MVVSSLETKMALRSEIRDRKTKLRLLVNIHESVTKVENLLLINSDTTNDGGAEEGIATVIDNANENVLRHVTDAIF